MHVIDSENVVETIAIVNNYYRLTMHVIESTIIQNFKGESWHMLTMLLDNLGVKSSSHKNNLSKCVFKLQTSNHPIFALVRASCKRPTTLVSFQTNY